MIPFREKIPSILVLCVLIIGLYIGVQNNLAFELELELYRSNKHKPSYIDYLDDDLLDKYLYEKYHTKNILRISPFNLIDDIKEIKAERLKSVDEIPITEPRDFTLSDNDKNIAFEECYYHGNNSTNDVQQPVIEAIIFITTPNKIEDTKINNFLRMYGKIDTYEEHRTVLDNGEMMKMRIYIMGEEKRQIMIEIIKKINDNIFNILFVIVIFYIIWAPIVNLMMEDDLKYELECSDIYADYKRSELVDRFLLERHNASYIIFVSPLSILNDIKELRARRFNLTNNGESNDKK